MSIKFSSIATRSLSILLRSSRGRRITIPVMQYNGIVPGDVDTLLLYRPCGTRTRSSHQQPTTVRYHIVWLPRCWLDLEDGSCSTPSYICHDPASSFLMIGRRQVLVAWASAVATKCSDHPCPTEVWNLNRTQMSSSLSPSPLSFP